MQTIVDGISWFTEFDFKTRYQTNINLKAVSYIKLCIFSKSWLIFFQLEFNLWSFTFLVRARTNVKAKYTVKVGSILGIYSRYVWLINFSIFSWYKCRKYSLVLKVTESAMSISTDPVKKLKNHLNKLKTTVFVLLSFWNILILPEILIL